MQRTCASPCSPWANVFPVSFHIFWQNQIEPNTVSSVRFGLFRIATLLQLLLLLLLLFTPSLFTEIASNLVW